MKIRNVHTDTLQEYGCVDEFVFIKPRGSKLHRLCSIPDRFTWDKYVLREIISILDKHCKAKKHDVYFFLFNEQWEQNEVFDKLFTLGIDPIAVSYDTFGCDEKGFLKPEIFN
jgi:hypothetical protein